MVGIKDVAALAGVSISTVSYVFSGKRPVSDATKIRVLKAVQQLDYHPGSGAAMLRRDRRTHLIVLSSPMHPYTDYSNYATFFFAVVARARHYHYNVVLLMDEDDTDELLRMSYSGMIDGVLLLDVTMEDPRVAQAHTSLVPYVSIGYARDSSKLLSVDVDFHAMGLYNSQWSIVIIFTVIQSAFGTYLLSSVYGTFPKAILEAATIDGASRWRILKDIVFPISKPTLSVMLVFFFIWTWNEYMIPMAFLIDNSKQTVPIAIASLTGDRLMDVTTTAAASLISIVPTLIFYLIFQRTLSKGITTGAAK